jgi:uncharacterized protein YerC
MKKNDYINNDKMGIDSKKENYSDTNPLVIHLLDQGYTHREIKHLTGLSICTISRFEGDL